MAEPLQLAGRYRLDRDRDTLLAALADPEVLRPCVPFCEALSLRGPGQFVGRLALRFGPLRLPVEGYAEVEPVDPPEGYRIRVGRGPAGGREVRLRLREDPQGRTVITYRVDVGALGPFAPFGRRWVERTAARESGRFFEALARRLGARVEEMPLD